MGMDATALKHLRTRLNRIVDGRAYDRDRRRCGRRRQRSREPAATIARPGGQPHQQLAPATDRSDCTSSRLPHSGEITLPVPFKLSRIATTKPGARAASGGTDAPSGVRDRLTAARKPPFGICTQPRRCSNDVPFRATRRSPEPRRHVWPACVSTTGLAVSAPTPQNRSRTLGKFYRLPRRMARQRSQSRKGPGLDA